VAGWHPMVNDNKEWANPQRCTCGLMMANDEGVLDASREQEGKPGRVLREYGTLRRLSPVSWSLGASRRARIDICSV